MPMHPLSVVAIGIVTAAAILAGMELFKEHSRGRFGYEDEDCFAYRCYEEEKEEFCRVEKEEQEKVKLSAGKEETVEKLLAMGFQVAKIKEAVESTGSFEEALELLLVTASKTESQEKLVDPIHNLSLSDIQAEREAIKRRLEELEEIERQEMFAPIPGNTSDLISLDSPPSQINAEAPVLYSDSPAQYFEQPAPVNLVQQTISMYQPIEFEPSQFEEPSFAENPIFDDNPVFTANTARLEEPISVIFEASSSVVDSLPAVISDKTPSLHSELADSVADSLPSMSSYAASSIQSELTGSVAESFQSVAEFPSMISNESVVSSSSVAESVPLSLPSDISSCHPPALLVEMEENEILMEPVPAMTQSVCTVYHESIDEDSSAIDNAQFIFSQNAVSLVEPVGNVVSNEPIAAGVVQEVHDDDKSGYSFKNISLTQDTIKLIHEIDTEESEDGMSQTSASAPSEGWDVVSNQ